MSRPQPSPAGLSWAFGAAAVVVAARWREISLHGGPAPFLDQWDVEARQVLVPWLEGKLSFGDFFHAHNEHYPVWPRLLASLEAAMFGRWDGQLQATLNAGFMGLFTGFVAAWLRRSLAVAPALALTLLAVALGSLPHSWENIVWGFQSVVPLALVFVVVHLHGSFAREPGTPGWWGAQAAGLAALFTLGSMWAAPLAVVGVFLWTGRYDWRRLAGPALLAAIGLALLVAARAQQAPTSAHSLAAANAPQFIAAFLTHAGWPAEWPGAALALNLPAFLLAWRLRRAAPPAAVDCTVLATALWTVAQAVAFAYARGSYIGFVSRYGDLLALGVLANGVALWRLLAENRAWFRLLLASSALAWCGAVAQGLYHINVQGHTLYFHQHSAVWSKLRREAVQQYLATRDQGVLSTPEVRGVLYPNPGEVAQILDHPRLVALLPASLRPPGGQPEENFAARAAQRLRDFWAAFAAGGAVLLCAGVLLTWKNPPPAPAVAEPAAMPWGPLAASLALGGLVTGSLLFLWTQPFEFRTERRWAHFLSPPGTVPDMTFRIVSQSTFDPDRTAGAASLWPEDFRNTFFGSHIDGPAFTGVIEGSPFPLASPWYIVPFAGYPVSVGNALRLRIEGAAGSPAEEIQCPGPNPGPGLTDIGFWEIDATKYAGRTARLVLYDGRTDAEGWVAAAPPYAVPDGRKIAASLRRGWAAEGTLAGLRSLQVIFAACWVSAAGAAAAGFARRRHSG